MLEKILEAKRAEVAFWKSKASRLELCQRAADARPTRDFRAALAAPRASLVAEVKRRSPSRGEFRPEFDPIGLARSYAANGARAISVLADAVFFGGGPDVVEAVANDQGVPTPVLFKEFVVDPIQILQARAAGADAVLLIVRATGRSELADLVSITHALGMEALVETFTEEEVATAMAVGAQVVGVNNRDLRTFDVDLDRSGRLVRSLPSGVLTVSESGLSCREDVLQAEQLGFHGVLIGEALLTAPDPGRRIRELLGDVPEGGAAAVIPAGPGGTSIFFLSLGVGS